MFCFHVCLFTACIPSAREGQKAVDPLELKTKTVVRAGNQTQILWKSSQCVTLLKVSPARGRRFLRGLIIMSPVNKIFTNLESRPSDPQTQRAFLKYPTSPQIT